MLKKTSSKLSNTILKSVSIRVLVVILISSILSFFHLYTTIESGVKDTLQKYVSERVKREEELFLLAQKNHDILKKDLIDQLQKPVSHAHIKKFNNLLRTLPDGTTRNKKELFDGTQSAGVFIPPGVTLTPELKNRIAIMMELAENYGKAFHTTFQNTYFSTSENIIVLYWPELPNWTVDLKADFNLLAEEYMWIADKHHNPERKSVWTGPYYDSVGKLWMASVETPTDYKNYSINIGHDVTLDKLIERVSREHLKGTYNVVFQRDGKLISHPQLIDDIQRGHEKFDIKNFNDPFLQSAFHSVINSKKEKNSAALVIQHPNRQDLLSFATIGGPGWYFLTVFPGSLIASNTLNGIGFIIFLALASLAFEIAFLYYGLKRDVIHPLKTLEESVKKISRGDYQARIEFERTDELGQLSHSFNQMAQQIFDQEKLLIQKVNERTQQLEEQWAVLIQKSKMASLGEMAGGIAHEINTPLAIISIKVEQLNDSIEENDVNLENFKKSLGVIKSTTNKIAQIIRGFRFIARDGSQLPIEKASMNTILEEVMSFCAEQMRRHNIQLIIEKNYSSDLFITCRPVDISQVLLNLLSNAKEAVLKKEERWIKVVITDHDSEVEINVIDSGPGISQEIQEKIMHPFFTTKEVGRGHGKRMKIIFS